MLKFRANLKTQYENLFIFLLLIAVVACKKDKSIPDSILYKNLDPPIQLNTVNSFKQVDYGICSTNYPSPTDSSTFFELDMDSDLQNDFRFEVSHFNWSLTNPSYYCGHCTVFEYEIQVSGLNPNDSISVNNFIVGPKFYEITSIISASNVWSNSDLIYLQGGCNLPVNFVFSESYLGVKHKNKLGWIHIAPFGNNGIEIREYALNNTVNKSIRAGQIK